VSKWLNLKTHTFVVVQISNQFHATQGSHT